MKFKKNIIADMITKDKSLSISGETSSSVDSLGSLKIIAKVKSLPIAILSVGLLLSAIGTYVNYSTQLDKNRQEISYITELSKNSEKLAKNTFLIQRGEAEGFKELADVKQKVTALLGVIKNGGSLNDDDIQIKPISKGFESKFLDIDREWESKQIIYNSIFKNSNSLIDLKNDIEKVTETLDNISRASQKLVNLEKEQNLRDNFIELSTISERAKEHVVLIFNSEKYDYDNTYQVIKDLKTVNFILLQSSKGEFKSSNTEVINIINNLSVETVLINKVIAELIPQINTLGDIQSAAKFLRKQAQYISQEAEGLNNSYNAESSSLKYQSALSIILFLLSVLSFGLLTLIFYEKSEIASKGKKIAEKNQANENSINLLIKKMNPLDEGDFTQRVFIDDKIVGRIAEKVDNTREIFGNIVKKIKGSSVLVKSSANETDNTSKNLLELSSEQYKKLGTAIEKLGKVSSEMDDVAQNAWVAKENSLKSKQASELGASLVEQSIEKMNQIRDTIQESSKKIKKSSESAQAITEVTGIIQNITKQIEILALNAAIQAASSGESGREFTVVAQAVQELALDSKEATNRILELVSDVQKDIGGAVSSMEKTTQEVVNGAKLNDDAGKALKEIKGLSEDVASKIEETSFKIEEKSSDMANISLEMKQLQVETERTADIVKLTSQQVDRLKIISEELENSVHGFKVDD